ncbi:hypothetical protein DAERI_050006 [Deinococcus aerius]|uniref:Uncharacterized protein n=1 Tax=Deinococcus aerius TaxID=200253 RepID=A0A2I9DSM2_9DEIO|nr:hypothetical protein [Deinococcus aerius]GBF05497.1 hypothetical protein DAERI_050006 [Deinococcus aerius]
MTDFRPGRPLPTTDSETQERQLYHTQRASGAWATMIRDESGWQWRLLRGEEPDGYGRGGWRQLQTWLAK